MDYWAASAAKSGLTFCKETELTFVFNTSTHNIYNIEETKHDVRHCKSVVHVIHSRK